MRIVTMFIVLAAPSVAALANPYSAQVTEATKAKVEKPDPMLRVRSSASS